MKQTICTLAICFLAFAQTACSNKSDNTEAPGLPNLQPPSESTPTVARVPQVFSGKSMSSSTTVDKIEGDMLVTEDGGIYILSTSAGSKSWVKNDKISVSSSTNGKDGSRGSQIFVGSKDSETLEGKLPEDILIDSITADVYRFDGTQFLATGLNIRGAQGMAGVNGKDGSSCSVLKKNMETIISCTDGTVASVKDGMTEIIDPQDKAPSLSLLDPSVLDKKHLILRASKNHENGTEKHINMTVDKARVITLPDSLQVTMGNAGSGYARVCVNNDCCTYRGGSALTNPLSHEGYETVGEDGDEQTARKRLAKKTMNYAIEIEKGRQYKIVSCSLSSKTVQLKQGDRIYVGIDSGDSSMETEMTATLEVN